MFSFTKIVATASVASLAAAKSGAGSCNTGPFQCCDTFQKASGPIASKELAALGIDLQDPNVLVGITCRPLNVIGAGEGDSCSTDPVCCKNNNYGGAIAIGCAPVPLN
ncbi:fungal hydrophobin [Neolentinus lepideus HHB14362 ss-1]|uniref:Hydrophobin n=1 Tax=Neolentinus lepideus HHB14362 ss-1 TaxID=1314782 RepID=A0A165VW30_9AGAM|nr:fungal hydrophobin [Neolentinus lepideus HHB14362 ss-1]